MPSYNSWETTNKMNNLEANAGMTRLRGFSFGENQEILQEYIVD